ALLLRGAMIGIGTALVERFGWILYPFGAFLFVAGVRMLWRGQHDFHPEHSSILRWARRVIPVSTKHTQETFFVTESGRRMATSLFLALLVLEISDLLFAV